MACRWRRVFFQQELQVKGGTFMTWQTVVGKTGCFLEIFLGIQYYLLLWGSYLINLYKDPYQTTNIYGSHVGPERVCVGSTARKTKKVSKVNGDLGLKGGRNHEKPFFSKKSQDSLCFFLSYDFIFWTKFMLFSKVSFWKGILTGSFVSLGISWRILQLQ